MKKMKAPQTLVLINPWIYDFAAYDLWSKPLGLLSLAGYLRNCGFDIKLIDCLDIHSPAFDHPCSLRPAARRKFGTGKFFRQQITRPPQLKNIDRPYSRYGIPPAVFRAAVTRIPAPACFLVTSLMSYWYPGVFEVIRILQEVRPEVPIILGGIYARLCTHHAEANSGATAVITETRPASIIRLLAEQGFPAPFERTTTDPFPTFDLYDGIDYICLLTSSGCPYRCRYCASHFLNPAVTRRDPRQVFEEILYWHRTCGVSDFAFYDDALLVSAKTHLRVILEEVIKSNLPIRFHTPNALHVREISENMARLLKASGFRTIRLGYETSDADLHQRLDNKVSPGDFDRAVKNLRTAGFSRQDIGAYILAGLPGQSLDSVSETIEIVARSGATPYLAEYSPIPHSDLWKEAVASSEYNLEEEPLYHNNTLLPCWTGEERAAFRSLKKRVAEIRRNYPTP